MRVVSRFSILSVDWPLDVVKRISVMCLQKKRKKINSIFSLSVLTHNVMNVSEIQYLREKEVHKLFEHIVKTLLRTKPPNPKEFLISSLAAKGVGESDTAHQQQHHHQQQVHQQFLNETVKSITSMS